MKNTEIDPKFQAFRSRMLRRIMTPAQRAAADRKRWEATQKEVAARRAVSKAASLERRVAREERARVAKEVRRASDPVYALQTQVRCLVSNAFRRRGHTKSARTEEILGCSLNFFRSHIERQFLPGMTWANRDLWHIDHIVALATAKTEADVLALNHFTNLRPLWKPDNLKKGAQVLYLL